MSITITNDANLKDIGVTAHSETLYIEDGATLTMTETFSYLLGNIYINNGTLLIDGLNISAGNNINVVGSGGLGDSSNDLKISVNGQGTLKIQGGWFDLGTTDGTANQQIDVSSYFDNKYISCIPMIQVETGRRLTYTSSQGVTPEVGDFVYLLSDRTVFGKIHSVGVDYIVVWGLSGVILDNSQIGIRKIVNNNGDNLEVSWTATTSGDDTLESGVYMEFGNARSNAIDYRDYYNVGFGGLVFHHALYSPTLDFGGTGVGGFIPPAGCNIRVPNININTSTTTDFDNGNAYRDVTTTDDGILYELECSSGGTININTCNLGNAVFEDASAYAWTSKYVGFIIGHGSNICGTRTLFEHCVCVQDPEYIATANVSYFGCTQDTVAGADILFCMLLNSETLNMRFGASTSININIEDCITSQAGGVKRSSTYVTGYYGYSLIGFNITRCMAYMNDVALDTSNSVYVSSSSNVRINMLLASATQTLIPQTEEMDLCYFRASNDVEVRGVEIIGNGQCGNYYVNITDTSNVKVRGIGMIDDKIDRGSDGEYLVGLVGLSTNVDIARCWGTVGGHQEAVLTAITNKDISVQNCSGDYASRIAPFGGDTVRFKGVHGGNGVFGSSTDGVEDAYVGSYGYNFHDHFFSDNNGDILCLFITPSPTKSEVTIVAGNPLFYKDGDLDMDIGDIIEFEQTYVMKGHISCTGVFSTIRYDGNRGADEFGTDIDIYFQYKHDGYDWNNTWLDLKVAENLTSISDMSSGISFKLRMECVAPVTSMSMIAIETTTSLQAQKDNMYPIDQIDVIFKLIGLQNNSEVRIYRKSDMVEIYGVELVSDTFIYEYVYNNVDIDVVVVIFNVEYMPIRLETTLSNINATLPITQEFNYAYQNN